MKKEFIKIISLVLLFTLGIGVSAYAFTSGYGSFAELYAAEDAAGYTIKTADMESDTTILALHGGGIERGTSELVEALNGYGKYNTYLFEGLKPADNGSLFLRAVNFDEPTAVRLVQKSDYTVSVIGVTGDEEVTYIGGQNKLLAELLKLHLTTRGYNVKTLRIPDHIAGIMDSNIANQNKLFNGSYQIGGVQIGISKGLRDKFLADPGTLNDYSGSINQALGESWPVIADQLMKVTENNGFFSMFSASKPNLEEKIDNILEKEAKTPGELIENTRE